MRLKIRHTIIVVFLFLLFPGISAYAQRPAEATAEVPALDSFHEVIFKIWHEAWPQKNTSMLRQLVPDVNKGIAAVATAPLPGILRDKKAAWDEGVKQLRNAGSEYVAAAGNHGHLALALLCHSGAPHRGEPGISFLSDHHCSHHRDSGSVRVAG